MSATDLDAATLAARLRTSGHRVWAETWVDTRAAAEWLGYAPRTLKAWRHAGTGPRWTQPGKLVLYALEDLIAWRAERDAERARSSI